MPVQYFEGIGRRKESVARVRLMKGSGTFTVNAKPVVEYFSRFGDVESILGAFSAVEMDRNLFDVTVVVDGGGVTGQTDAVRLGLARAINLMDPETHKTLRHFGLLTRDARAKERKKPGLKRARKAPTYTKR